jgi:NodT family efflux transporter outer membrane factor (OMF) lipoprotein
VTAHRHSILLASLLVTGCTVGPDFETPQPTMPTAWYGAAEQPTEGGISVTTPEPVELIRWWTSFHDPLLDSLVTRALTANLDLRQAEARIREARAARTAVVAGLWPQLDVSASYTRTSAPAVAGSRNLYQAGFDASWELDVFGGVRRDIEAADADIQVAIEDQRDVLVSLAAEVAANYLDLVGTRRQIAIAEQNLVSQRKTEELTRRRQQGGFVSGLDLANAQAQVDTTRSVIPSFEALAQQSIYSLGVLLGEQPEALLGELDAAGEIPGVPPVVPVGLPADLLRRRPDIGRAEAGLHAATARVGVATADLFPKIALTGSAGVLGPHLSSLDHWSNRFWSVGPSISWPVFDAGRLRALVDVQDAREEQAFLAYQKTVLNALQEVESALVAFAKEQEHHSAIDGAVTANRRALELATQLYTQGETDFLNVLNAERSLFVTEDALVQSDRAIALDLVALYKALGGGWELDAGSGADTTSPAP